MKSALTLIVCGVFSTLPAHAQAYFQMHGGAFKQVKKDLTLIVGTDSDAANIETEVETDPALVVGGLLGLDVAPMFSIESEATFRSARIQRMDVEGISQALDQDAATLALMVNGVFCPRIAFLPDPYIGAGLGYLTGTFDDIAGQNTGGQLAYQVKAGIRSDLLRTPGKFGLEVNYLATDDFDLGDETNTLRLAYGGGTGLLTYKIGF